MVYEGVCLGGLGVVGCSRGSSVDHGEKRVVWLLWEGWRDLVAAERTGANRGQAVVATAVAAGEADWNYGVSKGSPADRTVVGAHLTVIEFELQ